MSKGNSTPTRSANWGNWPGTHYISPPDPSQEDFSLLDAILKMSSSLDVDDVLDRLVAEAWKLTEAQFVALSILDIGGEPVNFVCRGLGEETAAKLAATPADSGVLAMIPSSGAVIIDDAPALPAAVALPEDHPQVQNFLGVPLSIHERVYGQLYLCNKEAGFTATDAQAIMGLAAAAAVAVENSRLYNQARNRERWIQTSQAITTALLEGADEEEALELVASSVREVADADTALIVLPSVGDSYACEIADGYVADQMIGLNFPPEGRAQTVMRENVGLIVDSMARARTMRIPALSIFGPALYAPLQAHGKATGVIILFRRPGRPEFMSEDLPAAESFAAQAALALELVSARHAEDRAGLLEERDRIARDLHDLAIQQLFATGMQLDSARQALSSGKVEAPQVEALLENALNAVDDSVRQIRSIVHNLREPDDQVGLVERLRREASLARTGLGFAPSLLVSIDGTNIDASTDKALETLVDERVNADIAADCVAVVREGMSNAARHARATEVRVEVRIESDPQRLAEFAPQLLPDLKPGLAGVLEIRVCDDGQGMDPAVTRRSGLSNLAARARGHGGAIDWLPADLFSRGTLLKWQVPLN